MLAALLSLSAILHRQVQMKPITAQMATGLLQLLSVGTAVENPDRERGKMLRPALEEEGSMAKPYFQSLNRHNWGHRMPFLIVLHSYFVSINEETCPQEQERETLLLPSLRKFPSFFNMGVNDAEDGSTRSVGLYGAKTIKETASTVLSLRSPRIFLHLRG